MKKKIEKKLSPIGRSGRQQEMARIRVNFRAVKCFVYSITIHDMTPLTTTAATYVRTYLPSQF